MSTRKARISQLVSPALLLVALVILWETAARLFDINKVILPAPSDIIYAVKADYSLLLQETVVTMVESVLGLLLGSSVAYLLATIFIHFRYAQDALFPYAIALKSTPLIAIAPLLVLWFGNGMFSKVIMSALVAFFPVLVNSVKGLTAINAETLELMNSLSATRWQVFTRVRFYNSLGYLFSALKTASSLAVVGAVIAEFMGAPKGIGHLMSMSSYYIDMPLMFAGVMMISFGGILLFTTIDIIERKIVFWEIEK